MRGKDQLNSGTQLTYRITPAYAGKRGKGWQAGNSPQDHPRLCGEKGGGLKNIAEILGSPPPMRGKVV